MKTLTSIIEEEEVSRRNTLRESCNIQLTEAIKTGSMLGAIVLVKTVFCFNLAKSKTIVELVRGGLSFAEAELKTTGDNI